MMCALGRSGIRSDKREGDGATPAGLWPIRRVLYRDDRVVLPPVSYPSSPNRPDDGWCDDPVSPLYNTAVKHPFEGSAEHLWRTDDLYDVVGVLGHNDQPPIAGRGSAIFMHIARPGYAPTEGCVALPRADLLVLLALTPPLWGLHIVAD